MRIQKITAAFFAVLLGFAIVPPVYADVPSPAVPSHPVTDRFNDAITFYASFNGYATADLSTGNPNPAKTAETPTWAEGISGKALSGMAKSLDYDTRNNIDLSKPGSIAVWISPQDWHHDSEPGYIFWINIITGDGQLMLARMGSAANKEALYAWFKKGKSAKSVTMGNTQKWTTGWHLLAANWGKDYAEFSVDGAPFSRISLTGNTAQAGGAQGHLFVGGGDAGNPYLMDELLVLDRPLANDEIQWIYQSLQSKGNH